MSQRKQRNNQTKQTKQIKQTKTKQSKSTGPKYVLPKPPKKRMYKYGTGSRVTAQKCEKFDSSYPDEGYSDGFNHDISWSGVSFARQGVEDYINVRYDINRTDIAHFLSTLHKKGIEFRINDVDSSEIDICNINYVLVNEIPENVETVGKLEECKYKGPSIESQKIKHISECPKCAILAAELGNDFTAGEFAVYDDEVRWERFDAPEGCETITIVKGKGDSKHVIFNKFPKSCEIMKRASKKRFKYMIKFHQNCDYSTLKCYRNAENKSVTITETLDHDFDEYEYERGVWRECGLKDSDGDFIASHIKELFLL